jgi:hypothetical protein
LSKSLRINIEKAATVAFSRGFGCVLRTAKSIPAVEYPRSPRWSYGGAPRVTSYAINRGVGAIQILVGAIAWTTGVCCKIPEPSIRRTLG